MCERSIRKCGHNKKADLCMQISVVCGERSILKCGHNNKADLCMQISVVRARGQFSDLVIITMPTSVCKLVLCVREVSSQIWL